MSRPVYRKQEQEPASEEVTEVAPGVLRLMLPIDLPGLGHVNCYALEDERGFALVDPGLPGPRSWQALTSRLKTAGIPLRRVHTAIITHSHVDHFGGSDQLRHEAGAEILTHEAFEWSSAFAEGDSDVDLELMELDEEALVELWKQRWEQAGTSPWGSPHEPPPDAAIRHWITMGVGHRFEAPEPTLRVADGDPVKLARREWFALHTPGHTIDHLCLWDPAEGLLLSGDHVLPTITPHIAGTTVLDDPLAAFFRSLERVGRLAGVTLALPAHGHPFRDLEGRTERIITHHHERLDHLRAAGDDLVDAPVEAFMEVLFKERAWGGMAASETFAHLDHLEGSGAASSRRDDAGRLRYTLNDRAR